MKLKLICFLILLCCYSQAVTLHGIDTNWHNDMLGFAGSGDEEVNYLMTGMFRLVFDTCDKRYFTVRRFDVRIFNSSGDMTTHIQSSFGRYSEEENNGEIIGYGWIPEYAFQINRFPCNTSLTITPEPATLLLLGAGFLCIRRRRFSYAV